MADDKSGAIVRAVAAEVIDAVTGSGRSLNEAIAEYETRLSPADRSLLRMLCFGCLRFHWSLQNRVDQLLDRPLKKRDRIVRALIAVGLFQLTETRIPDHAAVSQTVEAARLLRRPKHAGLLNAVLRRYMREQETLDEPSIQEAQYNHPAWLIDALKHDWPDDWREIVAANNDRAPMWLRVNRQRSSRGDYRRRLAGDGIASIEHPGIDDALCLATPMAVGELPGFLDGDVSVQDAAAQIAAPWLLSGARGRILDACSAPGGKSAHLKELGGDAIDLTCLDIDPERTLRVTETFDRLGLHATILAGDASKPEAWWNRSAFDGILLDAPCSASGVIRRHPDIKLLRRASDIDALNELQAAILMACWAMLAPGGRLLYATCSVLTAENDGIIATFLDGRADARENDMLPNYNIRDVMHRTASGYQVLPGTAGLDGFYYSCLEKVA